jgi:hypothetical protein
VQNDEHKQQLLKMADAWDSFAMERERIEQQQRKDEPPGDNPAPNSRSWTGNSTTAKPELKQPKARSGKSMPR